MSEDGERQLVQDEAHKWIRTPYHHNARVRGAGVDCAMIILESFADAGLIDRFDPGHYNHDWHLHRTEEKYLEVIERYCGRVDDTELSIEERGKDFSCSPSDILMWRVGRTFSHGAIVADWPNIIHAYFPARMVEKVSVIGTPMAKRPMRVYSFWEKTS